jgi:hypothetical protein
MPVAEAVPPNETFAAIEVAAVIISIMIESVFLPNA